jgi:hypothetical protein
MFSPILAMEQHAALVIQERHTEAIHERLLQKLRLGRKAKTEMPRNEPLVTKAPRREWAEA